VIMASAIQTDVPLVNVPFVDPQTGNVTEAWFIFLIQLWRRTGGGGGAPPDTLTIADVLALEETFSPLSPILGADALSGETTFGMPGQKDSILEMIFAPIGTGTASTGTISDQTFSSGTDFTPGTTTSLILSHSFSNGSQLWVYFDGIFQGDDQYSLSGVTLTFTSAIPVGVSKVYVKGLG